MVRLPVSMVYGWLMMLYVTDSTLKQRCLVMNDCMLKHEQGCFARVCMVFCHGGDNYNVNVMYMSAGHRQDEGASRGKGLEYPVLETALHLDHQGLEKLRELATPKNVSASAADDPKQTQAQKVQETQVASGLAKEGLQLDSENQDPPPG
eukprot:g25592.t1